MNEPVDEIMCCFERRGIEFAKLSSNELEKYKIEWIHTFSPADKREKALKCCLDTDFCGSGFLWHIFSWDILKSCFVEDEAMKKYDALWKSEAILLDSIENTAYRIKDSSMLESKDFEAMTDIVITDIDFCWTYAKTHEPNLGPYFYSV